MLKPFCKVQLAACAVILSVLLLAANASTSYVTIPARHLLTTTTPPPQCTNWNNFPSTSPIASCSTPPSITAPTPNIPFNASSPMTPVPCYLPLVVNNTVDTTINQQTTTTCYKFTRTWTAGPPTGNNYMLPIVPATTSATFTVVPPGLPTITISTTGTSKTFTCQQSASGFPSAVTIAPAATAKDNCGRDIANPVPSSVNGYSKVTGSCSAQATVTYTATDCRQTAAGQSTASTNITLYPTTTPAVTVIAPSTLKCVQPVCGSGFTITASTVCTAGSSNIAVGDWLNAATVSFECSSTVGAGGVKETTTFTAIAGMYTSGPSFSLQLAASDIATTNKKIGTATFAAHNDCNRGVASSDLHVCPCAVTNCPFITYSKGHWINTRHCDAASACGAVTDDVCGTSKSTAPASSLLKLCGTTTLTACSQLTGKDNYKSQLAAVYLNAKCANSKAQASSLLSKSKIASLNQCGYFSSYCTSLGSSITLYDIYSCSYDYATSKGADTSAVAGCLGTSIVGMLDASSSTSSNANCLNVLASPGGCSA